MFDKLKQNGFQVINIRKISEILKIKRNLYSELVNILKLKKKFYSNINQFLNNFHDLRLSDDNLNLLRTNIIQKINIKEKLIDKFYDIFFKEIKILLGRNIVGQRFVNIVVQQPNDKSVAPIHRDAPPNSPYELVFWVPLVNCYKTKSINMLPLKYSKNVISMFRNDKYKYIDIENFFKKKSIPVKCEFGQALIFKTNVFHYIPTNIENETRFSFNFRFKNLFTKYGSKTFPEYFKIMK